MSVPFSLNLDDLHFLDLAGPASLQLSPGGGVLPQLSAVPVSGIGALSMSPAGAASSSLLGLGNGSPSGVINTVSVCTLKTSSWSDPNPSPYITSTLSPNRPPSVVTPDIFHLLQTQLKIISDPSFREIVEKTGKMQVNSDLNPHMSSIEEAEFDFYDAIFQDEDSGDDDGDRSRRGRGRSPVRPNGAGGSSSTKSRQHAHSAGPPLSKSGKNAKDSKQDGDESKRLRSNSAGGRNSRRSRSSKRLNSIANGSNPMSCIASVSKKQPSSPRGGGKGSSVRSNSTLRGGKAAGKSFKGRGNASTSEVSTEDEEDGDEEEDELIQLYRETPPEVSKLIRTAKGHVYGVWLSEAHPLSLHSNQQCNFLHFVKDGSNYTNTTAAAAARMALEAAEQAVAATPGAPSAAGAVAAAPPAAPVHVNSKRFEWQMDLMREFDHKRFLKFEAMLVSQRQLGANASLHHAVPGNQFYSHNGMHLSFL